MGHGELLNQLLLTVTGFTLHQEDQRPPQSHLIRTLASCFGKLQASMILLHISPVLIDFPGLKLIVNVSPRYVFGVDVSDGSILWKLHHLAALGKKDLTTMDRLCVLLRYTMIIKYILRVDMIMEQL